MLPISNPFAQATGADSSINNELKAALALKRNLNSAFEKHADPDEEASMEEGGDEDIHSSTATSKPLSGSSLYNSSSSMERAAVDKKKRMEQTWQKAVSRPPMHPTSNIVTTAGVVHANREKRNGSKLKVFVRIRPDEKSEVKDNRIGTIETFDDGTIRTYAPFDSNAMKCARPGSSSSISRPSSSSNGRSSSAPPRSSSVSATENGSLVPVKEYKFERVFGPESNQETVYKETTAPLVESMFYPDEYGDPQSGLLFAYGITNAGKTYTIGNYKNKDPNAWGILPRAMNHIFAKLSEFESNSLELSMSYFEVYNEQIVDLLPLKRSKLGIIPSLKLSDQGRLGGIVVKGLAKHTISSVQQGLHMAKVAMKNRQTCSNNINSSSSRSHCICQFELMNKKTSQTHDPSVLWIVDLAGSERSKRTQFGGSSAKQQREAAQINQSLTTLMRCITQLASNQEQGSRKSEANQILPPYRDSKLTYLFMNHLSGKNAGKTAMIVNVNPSIRDYDETQHVLSYATVAREVFISAKEYYRRAIPLRRDSSTSSVKNSTSNKRAYTSDDDRSVTSMSSTNGQHARKVMKQSNKLSPRQILMKKASSFVRRHQKGLTEVLEKSEGARDALVSSQKVNEEMEALKKENKRLLAEKAAVDSDNTYLRLRAERLEDDLYNKEADVRQEMASEMEKQIQAMREEYEAEEAFNNRARNAATPSQSARKIRQDKTEKYIDELLEKLEEQEDEMQRMRERYDKEIAQLKDEIASLEEELLEKELFVTEEGEENEEEDENMRRETIIQEGRTRRACKGKISDDLIILPPGRRSEVACTRESDIDDSQASFTNSRESSPQKIKRVLRSAFMSAKNN